MAEIQAAQLIYTNVEADKSPARVRGFQLWCHSEGLPESVLTEARRRLENFKNPDAKLGPLVRHLFADLGEEHYLLSQTTPQDKPDKFGRKGRFHAHALILTADEFAKIHFNPFPLLEAFKFDQSPEEAEGKRRPDQPKFIDPITVDCPEPPPTGNNPPGPLADLLATEYLPRWVTANEKERQPVCLGEKPDIVLGYLRELFRLLPSGLRQQATFDTICFGSAVAANYFLIANPDERLAGTLMGFRYVLLNKKGETRVKLPPRAAGDPLAWFAGYWNACRTTPMTELDREAGQRFLEALHDNSKTISQAPAPSGRVLEVVAQLPETAAKTVSLAKARLLADYPRAFEQNGLTEIGRKLKKVMDAMDLPARIRFVQRGLDTDVMLKLACEALEDRSASLRQLDRDAIESWTENQNSEAAVKIRLMVSRWSEKEKSFDVCLKTLASGEKTKLRQWYFQWCQNTVPEFSTDGSGGRQMLADLLRPEELSGKELRTWRLVHQLTPILLADEESIPAATADDILDDAEIDSEPELTEVTEEELKSEQTKWMEVKLLGDDGEVEIHSASSYGGQAEIRQQPDKPVRSAKLAPAVQQKSLSPAVLQRRSIDLLLRARQAASDKSFNLLFSKQPEVAEFLAGEWFPQSGCESRYVYFIENQGPYSPKRHLVGVELIPKESKGSFHIRLLEALLAVAESRNILRDQLFESLKPDGRSASAADMIPADQKTLEWVIRPWRRQEYESLRERITKIDDSVFRHLANIGVFDNADGVPFQTRIGQSGRFFVGWEVSVNNPDQTEITLGLFNALVSDALEYRQWSEENDQAVPVMQSGKRYRFEWILRRLGWNIQTSGAPLQRIS